MILAAEAEIPSKTKNPKMAEISAMNKEFNTQFIFIV